MIKLKEYLSSRPRLALILLTAVYLLVTSLYPLFNKPHETVYCLSLGLDNRIGFSPPWIVLYISWYAFLPVIGFFLMAKDRKQYAVTVVAMILGLLVSYLTYILFRTTAPRPSVPGQDIFSKLVRIIHTIDQPYNAFPSIHVMATYALLLGFSKARSIKTVAKGAAWLWGLLIMLSTVFTKQHVVADILGGAGLAQLLHWLMTSTLGRKLHLKTTAAR